MREIAERAQRIGNFDHRRRCHIPPRQRALGDHAGGAAPERIRNETVAVVALALQRDENRTAFYLGRIGHHFSVARPASFAHDLTARGREDFCPVPSHSPAVYALAR